MKNTCIILIVLLAAIVIACGGGISKNITPDHLVAGMGQIKEGNGWYQRGCYSRALDHYFRAHEAFSASDQLDGVAMSLNNIATVYRAMGNHDNAVSFIDESYRIYAKLGDSKAMVRVLSNRASVLLDKNALVQAESEIEKARQIASRIKMTHRPLKRNEGVLLYKKKAYEQSEKILRSLKKKTEPDNHAEAAAVNAAIGNVMIATNRLQDALVSYQAALEADQWSGNHRGIASDLETIGAIYDKQGNYPVAGDYYQRSLKVYALMGDRLKVKALLAHLDRIAEKSSLDIGVTKQFVKGWLVDGADGPCD